MSTQSAQLKDIIEKAIMSKDPLVQKALEQERAFRERTAKELTALQLAQKKLTSEMENNKQQKEVAFTRKATRAVLQQDADLITKLNAALVPYKADSTNLTTTARHTLKFNKMKIATAGIGNNPGAQGVVNDHFDKLYTGQTPTGYAFDYNSANVTILDDATNTTTIFGNSRGTFYKTAALTTYLSTLGKTKITDISLLPSETGPWVNRSAMVHSAPIPATLDLLKLDPRFEDFTYTYNNRFYYVHSGYAFGGGRDGSKNPYAPEDCSSWIAKVTGCVDYSTADQLCFYRAKVKMGEVPAAWYNGPEFGPMNDLYDVIEEPNKVQAGQAVVWAQRGFDVSKDKAKGGLGTGGHTGLVLGLCSDAKDTKVAVLSYAREMPDREGFGVKFFPLFPEPENEKILLFSVKGSAANKGQTTAASVATTASTVSTMSFSSATTKK